jgi:hypothetical protein
VVIRTFFCCNCFHGKHAAWQASIAPIVYRWNRGHALSVGQSVFLGHSFALFGILQAAAALKEQLEGMMKDRADCFESMFEDETAKIRLDEAGWKQR